MNASDILLAIDGGCAVGSACETGTKVFWASDAGVVVGKLLAVVGILVVIMAVIKVFGKVTSGKMGEAVKIALGAAVFAAFLFNPALLSNIIGLFSGLITTVINSVGEITAK